MRKGKGDAPLAQHTAESLWLSELATCFLFLRLSLRKIILKERADR